MASVLHKYVQIQIHQVQIVKSGSATTAVPPYSENINPPKFTILSGGVDYCLGMAPPVIGSSLHLGWQYDVINSLHNLHCTILFLVY